MPLLREDSLVGGLVLCRKAPGAFAAETVDLVQTLANQSVMARFACSGVAMSPFGAAS